MDHLAAKNFLESLSLEAGKAILSIYSTFDVSQVIRKEDGSPLTAADKKSNDIIVNGLKKNFPKIPIISEEENFVPYSTRKHWTQFWLVDPLDGTKEFLKKNGEFTTNIALIENGVPVIGFVHAPALQLSYFGSLILGSFRYNNSVETKLISKPKDPKNGIKIVESRSHTNDLPDHFLNEVKILERVPSGSSIKLCLVAEGSADVYPRYAPTMEWDVAAGDAVYRFSGENAPRYSPIEYNKEDLKNSSFIIGLEKDLVDVLL